MCPFDLSVVLVHYRTPDLLRRAIEAVELDLRASDLRGEVVVVADSGDFSEESLVGPGQIRCLRPGLVLGDAIDRGPARILRESRRSIVSRGGSQRP